MSTAITRLIATKQFLCINNLFRSTSVLQSTDSYQNYDLVVVGGGIVGCATAREMKVRHPELRIAIVEKEESLAKHQTGHNSGVIHAGIYYTPGSMKAQLCVEGLKMSYDYVNKNNIPHKKVGKLIVARKPEEVTLLNNLYERALKNKCPDVELVDKENMKNYEPHILGEKGIWSPWTGIVDWAVVAKSFAEEFKKMGGHVHLNFEVTRFSEAIQPKGSKEILPISIQSTSNKYISTKYVLTCGGLYSDRLAIMTGGSVNPRIVPFRGRYMILSDEKKSMVKTNIYPVPEPGLPFLGVHFTPRMNGDIWLGPNAVLALSREGYTWKDVNIKDCIEMMQFSGLYLLASRYLLFGIKEGIKSVYKKMLADDLSTYIPGIKAGDIKGGPAGVRAQALDKSGKFVDDFVFENGQGEFGKRILHCRNAPSPGATSSMAIAKYIANKMESEFKF